MNVIGRNIRLLRQKQGWSQGEVAKKLDISIPAFSKIETGITDVNISRLRQISELFNVTISSLINTDEVSNTVADQMKSLKDEIAARNLEVTDLQRKVIDLYEELRACNKQTAAMQKQIYG